MLVYNFNNMINWLLNLFRKSVSYMLQNGEDQEWSNIWLLWSCVFYFPFLGGKISFSVFLLGGLFCATLQITNMWAYPYVSRLHDSAIFSKYTTFIITLLVWTSPYILWIQNFTNCLFIRHDNAIVDSFPKICFYVLGAEFIIC